MRKHRPCCPVCNRPFGIVTGTQPKDGQMKHQEIKGSLPGFSSCNTIEILYDFPSGIQGVSPKIVKICGADKLLSTESTHA